MKNMGIVGPLLSIIIQSLSNKVAAAGQSREISEVIAGVPPGGVFGTLLFFLFPHGMWRGFENKRVAFGDAAALIAVCFISRHEKFVLSL